MSERVILLDIIEQLRQELYLVAKNKPLTHKDVVSASQRLDKALNLLCRATNKIEVLAAR